MLNHVARKAIIASLMLPISLIAYYDNDYDPSYSPVTSFCPRYLDCGLELTFDYLLWNTRRSDLDYAIDGTHKVIIESASPIFPPDGVTKVVSPDYTGGFRLGISKESCGWLNWALIYTNYENSKSQHVYSLDKDIRATRIPPIFFAFLVDPQLQFAKGHFNLEYQQLDFEGAYQTYICEGCVRFQPMTGFRISKIDEKFNLTYVRGDVRGVKINNKISLDGYGPYLGFSAYWNPCCWLGFFGKSSLAILVSDLDKRVKGYDYQEGQKTDFLFQTHLSEWVALPALDFQFGAQLECATGSFADWTFAIGYEFHSFGTFPDFYEFYSGQALGSADLTHDHHSLELDGLFFRANVYF